MDEKKKSVKGQLWLKVLAFLVAEISGICMVFCMLVGNCFAWEPNSIGYKEEFQEAFEEELLRDYALQLYADSEEFSRNPDGLDGGNISYTITKKNSEKGIEETLYSNNAEVGEKNYLARVEIESGGTVFGSGVKNIGILGLLKTRLNYDIPWESECVERFVYAKDSGLFYVQTVSGKYFLMPEFEHVEEGLDISYHLNGSGEYVYFSEEELEEKRLQKETVENWSKDNSVVSFSDTCTSFGDGGEYQITTMDTVDKSAVIEDDSCYLDMMGGNETLGITYQTLRNPDVYKVYLSVNPDLKNQAVLKNGMTDYFWEARKLSGFADTFIEGSFLWMIVSLLVFVVAFKVLMTTAGRRSSDDEIHLRWMDQIPFGILTLLTAGCVVAASCLGVTCIESFYNNSGYFSTGFLVAEVVISVLAGGFFILLYCMSIAVRVKTGNFMRYTIAHYLMKPIRWLFNMIRVNVSFFAKAGILMGVLTIVEFFVLVVTANDDFAIWCFILFKLFEIPFHIYLLYQMYVIREGGRRVANGDYSHPIDTRRMIFGFKEHAENINNVGDGISIAVEQKMKSERFKTELITNVSHDIKTPLTSIINYVDLMKKEEITNPTVQEYIGILDRQSARLKKLIEDLMEASKASTGNLPVHMELFDATVMLTQVVGEFQERAQVNQLDIVVQSPEPPVNIMADGRHLWRVIDNLMSNICKYAQPGTRVYIDLERYHGMVIMTFKNISKERLNISSDELMERFVRGDSSRNTEGNGLGLSIAKSLADLMDANLAIQIDGDLFKVILSFEEK